MSDGFRLEHPRLGVLVLPTTAGSIVTRSFQDSGPQVRTVASPLPGADGTSDETRYVGSRVMTLDLGLFPRGAETRQELWDRIAPYLNVSLRVTLVKGIECGNASERHITVRRMNAPTDVDQPFVENHTISFESVGSPYYRSPAVQTVEVEPGLIDEPGFTFPLSFPLSFGGATGDGSGRVDAYSGGSAPASLVTRIYGPCVGPSVLNLTSGGRLDFPGLSIGDGNYLELQSLGKSARENGSAGANRGTWLDFTTAEWFGIDPGLNELRFVVESSGSGCRTEFVWQDHYL